VIFSSAGCANNVTSVKAVCASVLTVYQGGINHSHCM